MLHNFQIYRTVFLFLKLTVVIQDDVVCFSSGRFSSLVLVHFFLCELTQRYPIRDRLAKSNVSHSIFTIQVFFFGTSIRTKKVFNRFLTKLTASKMARLCHQWKIFAHQLCRPIFQNGWDQTHEKREVPLFQTCFPGHYFYSVKKLPFHSLCR